MARTRGLMKVRDEDGATMVIVALCLVALFCMLVLVVDVGGLLWKRRELVSGSDAAALAAAKTCAVPTNTDNSVPETQADTAAVANVGGLNGGNGGIIAGQSTCRQPRGYVTVQYSYPQSMFFAGILGASSQSVTTQATAAWGPLKAGAAVPIVLESGLFQSTCPVPDVEIGQVCAFWYDNHVPGQGQDGIGVGGFGFLNLDQWGVDRYDQNVCSNTGGSSTTGDYILHDYSKGDRSLSDPPPTYVCLQHGNPSTNWFGDLCARWSGVQQAPNTCEYATSPIYKGWPGPTILMPVNDCDQQVDNKGTIVPCGTFQTNVDKFAIIGFTTLQLGDTGHPTVPAVLSGQDSRAIGTPAVIGQSNNCGNNVTLGPAGAGAYGQGGWALDPFAVTRCQNQAPATPSSITNVVVTDQNKTLKQCAPAAVDNTCDYVYDATTHQLDWYNSPSAILSRQGADDYKIDFTWKMADTPASPGYCGTRPPDSTALCIVTTWLGYTDQNGEVGSGQNFGTQGHVLCDFTYNSCPAGVKP
jgi:Flp pilus assembly protein TadG